MFVFLLVTWIRWSFVRIRVDQILAISWKLLLPGQPPAPDGHRAWWWSCEGPAG